MTGYLIKRYYDPVYVSSEIETTPENITDGSIIRKKYIIKTQAYSEAVSLVIQPTNDPRLLPINEYTSDGIYIRTFENIDAVPEEQRDSVMDICINWLSEPETGHLFRFQHNTSTANLVSDASDSDSVSESDEYDSQTEE